VSTSRSAAVHHAACGGPGRRPFRGLQAARKRNHSWVKRDPDPATGDRPIVPEPFARVPVNLPFRRMVPIAVLAFIAVPATLWHGVCWCRSLLALAMSLSCFSKVQACPLPQSEARGYVLLVGSQRSVFLPIPQQPKRLHARNSIPKRQGANQWLR